MSGPPRRIGAGRRRPRAGSPGRPGRIQRRSDRKPLLQLTADRPGPLQAVCTEKPATHPPAAVAAHRLTFARAANRDDRCRWSAPPVRSRDDPCPQTGHVVVGDLRTVRVGRPGGVRLRPAAQPDPRRMAPGRAARRPRHAGRRVADPRTAACRLRRGRGRGGPRLHRARRVGQGRSRRAAGPGDRGGGCHDRAPGPAGAAAGLGDRQAVAAGLRRRRSLPRRGALVCRRDRTAAARRRRPANAARFPGRYPTSPAGTTR